MAAMWLPVSFQEVSVYFTEEEWSLLQDWQRDLYKEVMQDNLDSVLLLEDLWEPHIIKTEDMTVDGEGPAWKVEEQTQWDADYSKSWFDRYKNFHGVLDKVHHRCSDCREVVGSWSLLVDHKRSHQSGNPNTNHKPFHPTIQQIKHNQGKPYNLRGSKKWSSSNPYPSPRWAFSTNEETYPEGVDTIAGGKALVKYKELENLVGTKTFVGQLGNMAENGKQFLKCFSCPKIFTDVNLFIQHKRSHKENKSFACPDCGKGFVRKSVLKLHRRTHTGERPFVCSECGKRFSQRFNLVIHQRIHSGEKPYKCQSCDRSFRYKPALMRHESKCVKTNHRTRPGGKSKHSQHPPSTMIHAEAKTLAGRPQTSSTSSNTKPFPVCLTLTTGGQDMDTCVLQSSSSKPPISSTSPVSSQLVPRDKSSSRHLTGLQSANNQCSLSNNSICEQSGTKPRSMASSSSSSKSPSSAITSIRHKSLASAPSYIRYSSANRHPSSSSHKLSPSSNAVVIHQSGIKPNSTTSSSTYPLLKMGTPPNLSSESSPPSGGQPHLISSSTNNHQSSLKSPLVLKSPPVLNSPSMLKSPPVLNSPSVLKSPPVSFPAMNRAIGGKRSSLSFSQGFKSPTASLSPKYHPMYSKYHSMSLSSNCITRGTKPVVSSPCSMSCQLTNTTLLSSCKPPRSASSRPSASDYKTPFVKNSSSSSSFVYHESFAKHSLYEHHRSPVKCSTSFSSPLYSNHANTPSSSCTVLHPKSVTACPPPVQPILHHSSSSKPHSTPSLSKVPSPHTLTVGNEPSFRPPLVLTSPSCSSSGNKSPSRSSSFVCDKSFPNFPASMPKNSSSVPTLQQSAMASKSAVNSAKGTKHPEMKEGGQTMQPVENLFECGQCERSFTDLSQFTEHQKTHLGPKNTCPECNKIFHRRSTLLLHKRTHTGEKPYSCTECGKSFSQRFNLVVHERIHTGERPYTCNDCNKAFRYRTGLLRHQTHALCVRKRPVENCPVKPPPSSRVKKSISLIDTCQSLTMSNVLSSSGLSKDATREVPPSEDTQEDIPLLPPTSKTQSLTCENTPTKTSMPHNVTRDNIPPTPPTSRSESQTLTCENTPTKTSMLHNVTRDNIPPTPPTSTSKPQTLTCENTPTKMSMLRNVTRDNIPPTSTSKPQTPTKTSMLLYVARDNIPPTPPTSTSESQTPTKTSMLLNVARDNIPPPTSTSESQTPTKTSMRHNVARDNIPPTPPTPTSKPQTPTKTSMLLNVARDNIPPTPPTSTSKPQTLTCENTPTKTSMLRNVTRDNIPPTPPTSTSKPQTPTETSMLRNVTRDTIPPKPPTSTSKPQTPTKMSMLRNVARDTIPPTPPTSTSESQTLTSENTPTKTSLPLLKAPMKTRLLVNKKENEASRVPSPLSPPPPPPSHTPCSPHPLNVAPPQAPPVQNIDQNTNRPKINGNDANGSGCNEALKSDEEKMQFKCEHCKRSFDNVDKFMEHQITHSTARHACAQCGKAFSKTSQLVLHQRTHTGEKPYCCPKCSKQFSQKFNLVVHQRIHTGEKPYRCSDCSKEFRYRTSLIKHQKYGLCS
ncbi:mucin-2-like isoform X2 [Rana temporaria]|uniref:mucin-2-like isoform X2 n=1 Tax=Rana temporaria TaxID=8407 RepID=UPI001AADE0C6|nr:mucin-2-like isoform X2 [Rana temporaria]